MTSLLNFEDIAKIFEEIELRLISSLKRNLQRHKAEERKEGFQWSAWQAEKLRNMEKFRRENLSIMNEYTDVIDEQTRRLMEEQFKEGEELVNSKLGELKQHEPEADSADIVTHNNFFGVNNEKMQSLITDITSLEKRAETAALRMTDDVYRQTVNKVQLAIAAGSMNFNEALDIAVKDFLDKGINCIVYSDGKRVNIADYARMALRTTSARASLQGQAKRFAQLGYDTVLVSQYGGCSKTCEPWQGQVYIDDVFTVWEGEHDEYQGKSNYCGQWFWLLSYAIKNGLFHPNCRHTMSQYIHGETAIPKPIPAERIKEQRELEEKQRAMERKIRKLKRFAEGTCNPETAKAYRKKLREAQHEIKVFVDEHNDVLRRDYSREKYYGEMVDKPQESGIINNTECTISPDKINKFFLKPGAKHAQEFFDVGYSENDFERLNRDLKACFDYRNAVDIKVSQNGVEKFSIFTDLGVGNKKRFRTVWQKDTPDSTPRIITAHREDD
nr:MAG: minor capsid protein 2 [Bacteriophage sp.]